MEMIENFAPSWLDHKVPSPSESDDSGLGWSPDHLSADLAFQLDNAKNNNTCFNYIETESVCSPQSLIEGSPGFSPFNEEQKQSSDVCELLEILDQKADHNTTNKQLNKKSNSKKRASTESAQNTKLERCFQPKTGNGKPRQTSVKRKPNQKNVTAYPYPGVRVETVREKLRKMREGRGAPSNQTVSSTIQSLNTIADGYPNQGYSMPSPNNMTPSYQQSYIQQHPQDLFAPSPPQAANFSQAPMMSPMSHNSPTYSGPSMSPHMSYDLNNGGDAYAQSLPSSSPTRSPTCSPFQQKLPPSPEMSPGIQSTSIPSPVSQFNEVNFGAINPASNACRFGDDQFNYTSSNFGIKQNSVDDFSASQFNNGQFVANGVRDLVQSVRRGDVQQLRTIFSYNHELVDTQDETGKALVFHAIESSQFEAVKLLINFHANLNLLTAEGNTVLHTAAICPKSDILVLLLKALQPKEVQMLMCKLTMKKGSTPLHLAAEANLINNFIQLLHFGANFLAQDRNGYSSLHFIVRNANIMAMRALLQVAKRSSQISNGKKLHDLANLRSNNGNTALHYAADLHRSGEEGQRNQYDIVQLLMANGADPLAVNVSGKSPKSLLPQASELLRMVDMHLMQNASRCGYAAPEMHPFQMGCGPTNQYNGAVFPHCQ